MSGAHLSSLGLAGLHLELVTSSVNSLAARAVQDDVYGLPVPSSDLIEQYDRQLENQSVARVAFRAELERMTGLPADLIERRLSL